MLTGGVDLFPYAIENNQSFGNFLEATVHVRFQLSADTHNANPII